MNHDVENLYKRLGTLKENIGITAKSEKIKELTFTVNDPGFWNNQSEAVEILEELARLKKEVEEIDEIELKLLQLRNRESVSKEELDVLQKMVHRFELNTLFAGEFDGRDAVINFLSGAGGDDAQEWTSMLLEMYRKYAEKKRWNVELVHQGFGELGGTKEATLEIRGSYAYGFLKKEAGVHRLVRISPFSAKKLRHTSFALVEVLPYLKGLNAEETKIDAKDIRVDLFRSSGPGGQNVNRRETAVRVTHIPTGFSVASQSQRSQLQNKEKAFEILRAKLYQFAREKRKDTIENLREKVSVEWGHQIRSYVFDPYQLVKDHRTGVETSNIEGVLQGELDEFIEAEIIA